MRTLRLFLGIAVLMLSLGIAQAAPTVKWRCTTDAQRWVDKGALSASTKTDAPSVIQIDPSMLYQKIEGWGGCFNELGWDALSAASEADRDDVIKALFDPKDGCKFNVCRMPIGANDYAMDYYSLNDNDQDYSMSKFSLDRDRKYLIPYIKAAMNYRSDLKMWGSPWSPPAWMKSKKRYSGGNLNQDPKTLAAYALYFEKYVQAYQAEGINVFAVHVQNEPFEGPNYPSCLWTGQQMRDFIKNYLGPQFKKDKVNAEIWLGTINQDKYKDYVQDTLKDPAAAKYISGCGFQWGGRPTAAMTRGDFPDMRIYSTEHECGNCWWGDWGWGAFKDTAPNDWYYGDYTLGSMIEWLKAGVNAYTQWNMILEPTGKSSWGWPQNSMITVFKDTGKVRYNPQFFAAKHFSCYVQPGAYRIGVSGTYDGIGDAKKNTWPGGDKIAFVNPDGEQVIIVRNNSDQAQKVAIRFGKTVVTPTLPARSFNTFTMPGSAPVKNPYERISAKSANSKKNTLLVFKNMAFGMGSGHFEAGIAGAKSGKIEIRLDGPKGKLVGTCMASKANCVLKDCYGFHDVYLKLTGKISSKNIGWIRFERYVPALGRGDGLQGQYFNSKILSEPKLTRIDPTIDWDWADKSPDPSINPDYFSAKWTGKIEPRYTDNYTFYLTSDNGCRLWLDGKLLIDEWNDKDHITYTGKISMKAGRKYDIQVDFYEATGDASVRLEWECRGQGRQVIPKSQLYSGM